MSSPSLGARPLVQLTLLRFREFVREPEALFWTLVFPVIITTGLGVAFRNQAPDVVRIAAVTPAVADALSRDPLLLVDRLDMDAARRALSTGRVVLVAEPGANGGVVYRYDDTNPEGRTARMIADRALQLASGRVDPVPVQDDVAREVGSRYIDFLVPGLVGMGIMSNAVWGLGFSIVDARRRKLMKRIIATPMRRMDYLLSFQIWRMFLLVFEVGVPVGFGVLAFGVPVRGSILEIAVISVVGSLAFSALGLLIASRAKTIEAVSGTHERRARADVDSLGRLFLVRTLSGRRSALHQGAAAHGARGRPARQHAARRESRRRRAIARGAQRLPGRVLRPRDEAVQMAVSAWLKCEVRRQKLE